MIEFIPSTVGLDSEILTLMEAISLKQGEITVHKRRIQDEVAIESMAVVDAVHFSTKIEGNSLSRDQVTEALISKKVSAPGRDLNEVLNYSRARRMARQWAARGGPFNDEWILTHHAELLKGIVKGRLRGHYREAQCVVQDSRTHSIIYMAPTSADVPVLMKGLLSWMRRQKAEGASSLLLAAQFHFEFVTIHPFMDGNGRTARLLTNGILSAGGYEVERYAALEKQHELNREAYYLALRSLQSGNYYDILLGQNIRSWVKYWLKCLLNTYEEALVRMTGTRPATGSLHSSLLDSRLQKAEFMFRRHQILRAGEYADLAGLGRTQAVADLNSLVEAGAIEKVGGGRSTVYRIKGGKPERGKQ